MYIFISCMIVIILIVVVSDFQKTKVEKESDYFEMRLKESEEKLKKVTENVEIILEEYEIQESILEDIFTEEEIDIIYNTKRIEREGKNDE